MQQTSGGGRGAQFKLEVSSPGDSTESEADSAASAMVEGKPASVGSASGALHRYTSVPKSAQKPGSWDAKHGLRVADDGMIAVASGKGAYSGTHDLWAEPGLVGAANATLKSQKSVVQLRLGGDKVSGDAPDGGGSRTLTKVEPENASTKTKGDDMTIWADCGRSGRDVMGAGQGTGGGQMSARFQTEHKPDWWEKLWHNLGGSAPRASDPKTTGASDPEDMKKEIFQTVLGGSTPDDAFKKYQALSPADRDAFDKKAKINRYAEPGVGEGFTMSTGGNNVAGHDADTWNFHWGGVVLTSGSDRVTLENYATGVPDEKNKDWSFQMYGPASKAGQTFHDQHKATDQHGEDPTTMAVTKK